ncbi:hypothetical protein JVU11DRAFT_6006 [Chiua virens]|nr:hypothetical protein JVU11DRAFT_6006 [Chiua virens]
MAVAIDVMMSNLLGNLWYCFMPIASWVTNTPKECLLMVTGPKASPITIATAENFGDSQQHPPWTMNTTLTAIYTAFWFGWAFLEPCDFITVEPLYHFH